MKIGYCITEKIPEYCYTQPFSKLIFYPVMVSSPCFVTLDKIFQKRLLTCAPGERGENGTTIVLTVKHKFKQTAKIEKEELVTELVKLYCIALQTMCDIKDTNTICCCL